MPRTLSDNDNNDNDFNYFPKETYTLKDLCPTSTSYTQKNFAYIHSFLSCCCFGNQSDLIRLI